MTGALAPSRPGRGRRAADDAGPPAAATPAHGQDAARERARREGERDARPGARARVRRVVTAAGVVLALGAIGTAGWWGPRALSRLAFFRVRRVEIEGARYASPRALVARLGIDTAASVWTDLDALTRRVAADPLVDRARVERRLPGVLRVVVHERVPVAVVPGGPGGALVLYDSAGVALPVAPARVGGVDVPVAASADRALLGALGALRSTAPRVYARVLEVTRAPRAAFGAGVLGARAGRGAPAGPAPEHDELDFVLAPATGSGRAPASGAPAGGGSEPGGAPPLLVRAAVDVGAARFAELGPVEDDLARRGVRAAELDLRFRDQVVARLP
ncbi:hypothetical protein tb265_28540 [Gemmatimonadetes bacterium T265]|nr:hypothetical protein tb265_28540 [Gemmatimonadetes bacterium T265]